ncbi:MAG: disulfide bond formation protein B [Pseudomonadota bacterium]
MARTGPSALQQARWLALGVPAVLLGGAYVSEYGFGLYPCELCWWQRYAHFAALALALAAFALPRSRWPVALAALAIAASAGMGLFHAGVEYHWWDGLTACTSTADLGHANPLDAIWAAPLIRCDQPQWTLLGISLAGFNFLLSGLGAACIARLLARSRKVQP